MPSASSSNEEAKYLAGSSHQITSNTEKRKAQSVRIAAVFSMDSRRSRSRSPILRARRPRSPDRQPYSRGPRENFSHYHNRRTADREARDWLAKEDEFVLKQAKKKSRIRVLEGRAQPIDWLAVTLTVVDPEEDVLEDNSSESDMEIVDPVELVSDLDESELAKLETDIEHYLALEKRRDNRQFWRAMKLVCQNQRPRLNSTMQSTRGMSSVAEQIESLISTKTPGELDDLEYQIRRKLRSDEAIDFEYWQRLLESVHFYQAKGDLRRIYRKALDDRIEKFEHDQTTEAESTRERIYKLLNRSQMATSDLQHGKEHDPEPKLSLEVADKRLVILSEQDFLQSYRAHAVRVQRKGYVPMRNILSSKTQSPRPADDVARDSMAVTANAGYDREVAHGLEEDEELFAAEEDIQAVAKKKWEANYRARKPKYVNRVQMGYEWNKYNQTHYDQDNPPPKVVQGYRFNIFYPDLIDKTKAPTYRIERENGRKKGQSLAPAGEEDTCIIRFMSGPPYEDLAFRIVDKEWDYSAKKERGFRSIFDRDVLQLHFQFKKVYYRK